MPAFSETSEARLKTCHPKIIQIMRFAIEVIDFKILCGYRGEEEQNAAYPKYSLVKYPLSKHNHMEDGKPCSLAIDIIPYDNILHTIVGWDDAESFALLAGHVKMAAYAFDIKLRWGHDWNNNNILSDEKGKFVDRPHFELMEA